MLGEEGGRPITPSRDHLLLCKEPVYFCVSTDLLHIHPLHPSPTISLYTNISSATCSGNTDFNSIQGEDFPKESS